MINAQRLSKIIQEKESIKTQNYLLSLYSKLTPEQRSVIRKDLEKLKK